MTSARNSRILWITSLILIVVLLCPYSFDKTIYMNEMANGTEDIWWILEGWDYPRLWWELIEDNITESFLEEE